MQFVTSFTFFRCPALFQLRFAFPGEDQARRIADWLHVCHGDVAYAAAGNAAFLAPPCHGVAALETASTTLARHFDGLEGVHRQESVGWKAGQRAPTWFVRCALQLADAILDGDGYKLCVCYGVQLLCQGDTPGPRISGSGHSGGGVAASAAAPTAMRAPLLLSRAHKEATTGTAAATSLDLSPSAVADAPAHAAALPDYDSSIESGGGDDDDGLDALDYYACFDALQSERSGNSHSEPSPQHSLRLSGANQQRDGNGDGGNVGGGGGGGGGGSAGGGGHSLCTASDLAAAMAALRGTTDDAPIEDWIASMLDGSAKEAAADGAGAAGGAGSGEVQRRASIRSIGSVVSSISGAPFHPVAHLHHRVSGADPHHGGAAGGLGLGLGLGLGRRHNSDDWTHRATADALPFMPTLPSASSSSASSAVAGAVAAGANEPGGDPARVLLAWTVVAHVEFAVAAGALRIARVTEYVETC